MLNVMTIVGTRPEIVRLSRTIAKLDCYTRHTLVHTGQNYDYALNEIFFDELGLRKPDYFLNAAGNTPAETVGQIIIAVDKVLETVQPEALLLLGDTNSCLAAIAAKRRKIPIFHMEAGNRCFDMNVPEEINRRIIDHTADINLPYSDIARDYLIKEGFPVERIIKTGSPLREVLDYYKKGIDASTVLSRLNLQPYHYFVASSHREENVDSPENLKHFFDALEYLVTEFNEPVIVSVHPRMRKRIEAFGLTASEKIIFSTPFGLLDYIHLQQHARVVLSDSGTITEEASILNFPAINLRNVHERPEGFEEAAVMFTGLSLRRIQNALAVLAHQPRGEQRALRLVQDYAPDNVSEKVLRIILSYTDYVNQRVWQRSPQR